MNRILLRILLGKTWTRRKARNSLPVLFNLDQAVWNQAGVCMAWQATGSGLVKAIRVNNNQAKIPRGNCRFCTIADIQGAENRGHVNFNGPL